MWLHDLPNLVFPLLKARFIRVNIAGGSGRHFGEYILRSCIPQSDDGHFGMMGVKAENAE
jgi:hypothetical protein